MQSGKSHSAAPSRRILLALAGALPVAALPVVARAEPGGGDAELIALVAAMRHYQGVCDSMAAEPLYPTGSAESDDFEARADAADDGFWGAADQVVAMQATTAAGLRAKADAMRIVLRRWNYTVTDRMHQFEGGYDFDERMAWSLARDVLAGGRAAA